MLRSKKNKISLMICAALVISTAISSTINNTTVSAGTETKAKNVIMLIPDGMSVEATTAARWCNGGQPLAMDDISTGLVITNWSGGPITDSAPAGTAYATGHKTDDGHIGTSTKATGEKPYASVLEAAKLQGKATGVVVTCEFSHATPADFTAHAKSRKDYNSIMKQQIYSSLDVMLGGGMDLLSADSIKNQRGETTDLTGEIKGLGYDYVTTRDQMFSSNSNKLWGMFAPMDLQYSLDSEIKPEQPSIEDMTKKAMDVLSKDQNGFFLMVEGSKIDWAAHANDPAADVGDILAFDKAVKAVLDFAKNDGNTVVVVAADHGTGGMTIGNQDLNGSYSKITFDQTVNKLKSFAAAVETIAPSLIGKSDEEIITEVKKNYEINDLTLEEIAKVRLGKNNNGIYYLANVISKRAGIGWDTSGHVGGDIALYNYVPANVEALEGVVDNTDVGNYLARVMGVDLEIATSQLFMDSKLEFEKLGATVTIDNKTDSKNPVAIVTKGSNQMKLYINTNKAEINGKAISLNGVTVSTNGEDVSLPKQAVDTFQSALNNTGAVGNNSDNSNTNTNTASDKSKDKGQLAKTGSVVESIILLLAVILISAGVAVLSRKKKKAQLIVDNNNVEFE